MRLSRLYLWLIAACVLIGAFTLVNAELMPLVTLPRSEIYIAASALALAYGVVGLGCAAVYERGRSRLLMVSGMLVGLLACIGWVAMIVSPERLSSGASLLTWMSVWPCVAMLTGLVLLLPMRSGWRRVVRASTIVMLTAFALFIACAVTFHPLRSGSDWNDVYRYERSAEQIGWSLGLLTLGSLVTTLIIGIAGSLIDRSAVTQPLRVPYWLQCPRCGREQEALTGEHHCVACQLRTKVELT